MRIEKSVTSITWIPSEAIKGMPKMPFEMGVAHYDAPPPDKLEDLEALRQADAFREANELRAWAEFEDGKPSGYGYSGGGHMGLPAPRRVRSKPFFRIKSASAWTTLSLTIKSDGSYEHGVEGASPFPRHWIYDDDGNLVVKSGTIDFEQWYRESHGKHTPWGDEDSEALTTAVESELERELSASIMRAGKKLERRNVEQGSALVTEGEEGGELFLLLDGMVDVEVNGDRVAEIGPGALLGERALIEGGKRTATIWAKTPIRVVVVPADAIDESTLPGLAASHRREDS